MVHVQKQGNVMVLFCIWLYLGFTLFSVRYFKNHYGSIQKNLVPWQNVTLDHKTSLKCQFFEIKMYALYESRINKLSINVWFVRIGQYLVEI